jgi:hypothetical protein
VAGRDTGFCITTAHRAITQKPPHSPVLAPSDFWLFHALKMALRGALFTTMEDNKWNATAESGRFQKKPSAGDFNNGRMVGASVCVCVCVCARARAKALLRRLSGKRCRTSHHYSAAPPLWELFDCPVETLYRTCNSSVHRA